jgi:enoyl-CoA hydratase/carnithine racemase
VAISTPEALAAKSRRGQAVIDIVENLGKPVVAALGGLAFGGGLELAMGCTVRLARAGQAVLAAQPEPKLGVIPGYGGTQRLPRLIGLGPAWPLLRLGTPLSSAEAVRLGLVREEVPAGELLDRAVALARDLAEGRATAPGIPTGPIPVPADLPDLDLGDLSRRTDAIQREVILAGARTTLAEGLRLESEAFGACHATEDYHLGMRNFVEKGPRHPAPFVHR